MIRHIFIARFKDNVAQDAKEKQLSDMKALKEKIPFITSLAAGFTTDWVGITDSIAMSVDFKTKEDFEAFMVAPYHADYVAKNGGELFDESSYIIVQYEF